MKKGSLTAFTGFVVLFCLYHAAEYMILFQNSALGFLAFQSLFFIAAWAIARWQGKSGLAAWGLDFKKRFLLHLALGAMMGIVLYSATFLFSLWSGSEKVIALPPLATILSPLGLFIFGNFFSSFSEDVLTRGYVYHHLAGSIRSGLLVAVSAAIYVLNHIYRLGEGGETYLYLFALGVLYVIPLVLTKRLWFTGGMHWAGNVVFYGTHGLWKTEELEGALSPNYILVGVALLMMPLSYFLITILGLRKDTRQTSDSVVPNKLTSYQQHTLTESL